MFLGRDGKEAFTKAQNDAIRPFLTNNDRGYFIFPNKDRWENTRFLANIKIMSDGFICLLPLRFWRFQGFVSVVSMEVSRPIGRLTTSIFYRATFEYKGGVVAKERVLSCREARSFPSFIQRDVRFRGLLQDPCGDSSIESVGRSIYSENGRLPLASVLPP